MHQKMWIRRGGRHLNRHLTTIVIALWVLSPLMILGCDPTPPAGSERESDAAVISPPTQVGGDEARMDQGVIPELPSPLFNSVLPTRAPTRGGVRVRIIGAEFRSPMYVRVGELPCAELIVETSARMICVVPAVEAPSVVDVKVAWITAESEVDPSTPEAESEIDGGISLLTEAFTYYQPLIVAEVTPAEGPASGSTTVEISGEGFSEPMDVRFGDLPARSVVVESDQLLTVVTPASAPGAVDVSVRSAQELQIKPQGFNFQVPIGLTEITPRWGSVTGGERAELYGYGLYDDSEVTLDGARAQVSEVNAPGRLSILTPPSSRAGWASITIENSNGQVVRDEAFLYLDDLDGPFEVFGLIPQQLPADRGGRFMIGGNGFDEETRVKLDGAEINCQLEASQRLSCFAPAHAPGEVEVIVQQSFLSERLRLRYINPLELYQLTPDRAAVSGGALIKVQGRGLSPQSVFALGDLEVPVERFVSPEEVWLRAPPHPAAVLDLRLREGGQEVFLPQVFTYFDPISRYGGTWGEVIEGSVNVTVLNIYDFSPIPEVTVEVRDFDDPQGAPRVIGLTDEQGQATLSAIGLTGPVHINFAKLGFEVQTLERVVSENVTVLLFPFTPPEGMGEPPPPPDPVQLSGTLTGLNDIPKPLEPGYVLRAFVDVSHQSMLSRAINPAPAPLGILSEDGPFEISARPGQMALVGTAAYVPTDVLERYENGEMSYWLMRRATRPIKIGMIRFLSLSPAASIEGLDLRLNRDLEMTADVRLINPSSAAGTVYTDSYGAVQIIADYHDVRAFFDLGPDGYWELDLGVTAEETQFPVRGLPDLSVWPDTPSLQWFVQSTVHPGGSNSYVYHAQSDLSRAVEIGPFVGAPYLASHGNGDTISVGDTLRWDFWPGVEGTPVEPPQATVVRFYQGGLPVWTFTLPGGVNQFTIPPLPAGEQGAGLVEGSVYVIIETLTTPEGLDYQDYNLLDLNSPQSYSTHQLELIFE